MSATRTMPVLTPEDHEHFLRHGFVVLKNAVPPQTIAAAVDLLESGTFRGVPGAADYEAVRGAPVEACVTDTVLDAISELFGDVYPYDRRRGATDMPRPHEPGAAWAEPVAHVDDDYPTVMPNGWALGMFIFLTPVRSHGGAFVYAPGSPYRYRPVLADNPEWRDFVHAESGPAPEHLQEFLAEPGDVLLFHHLMGHSGTANVADPRTRHALLSRFHPQRRIVPGTKPFDAMATIEKANSTRYLAHRFGSPHRLPDLAPDDRTTQALRAGFSPHPRPMGTGSPEPQAGTAAFPSGGEGDNAPHPPAHGLTGPSVAAATDGPAASPSWGEGEHADSPLPRTGRAGSPPQRGGSEGMVAYAALRTRGLTHLFYVEATQPTTILRAHSRNWVDWDVGAGIERPGEPIRALTTYQQGSEVLLFIATGGAAPATHILASHDLQAWSPLATLPDSICGAGHFNTGYGSKRAHGNVVFYVSPSRPAVVQARWGQAWAGAATWSDQAPAAEVGPGAEVVDAFVRPTLGEAQFALVADVHQRGAPAGPRPFYALSRDSARYEDVLQPLTFSTPTPPRQIRVYARARRYWLVTYLRRLDGRDRIVWGAIDWEKTPFTLEEIDTAQGLEAALYVVGLK